MTVREIADLFEQLELHLIASLKRNLTRHKKQEQDEGGIGGVPEHWEAWQAAKLRDIRRFRRENEAILGEYSPRIEQETENLLREQYAEGGSDGFFRTSDEKLRSLIREMQHNEARVERAALRYMNDVYRKTILRTATAMTAGGMTLQKATDEATKDFLAKGINCVRYADGRQVNIASYAEMALRACSTRAMLMGEAKQREKMGVDTVLVSQYGACSDTCLPWQGKVYIDDVFQEYHGPGGGSFGVSRNGRQYLFLSVAIKAGLFHPNCRHTVSTWFEGISTRPKPMNIREIERVNKLETRQRYLERRVREAKRQAAGLTDEAAQAEAQEKLDKRQAELDDFLREHDDVLRRDRWRERDTGVPKDWETIGNNQFTNAKSDDTISVSRENGVKTDVNYVCKLNKELYQVVSPNIEADDVIITDQQIEHVNEGHPNNYERFNPYLPSVIADPDFILEGNKPNTALVLKSIEIEGQILEVVLRLRVTGDPEDNKNSIISMWGLSEKRFNRLLRRGKILYKKE